DRRLDYDGPAGERHRDDEQISRVEHLGGREADAGRRDVGEAHVEHVVPRQVAAEEYATLRALGDGDPRRGAPHLAMADTRDGGVHEGLGAAVEVGLVDLEL